jgi:hypothetical protein
MKKPNPAVAISEIRPGQSIELLKELHILTRDGKLNQDTRRKLKQVYHLYQFIEPLLAGAHSLADHGAGKSYLGFILYDLFFKEKATGHIYGIESRKELVEKSRELAKRLGFERMSFLDVTVEESTHSSALPEQIDVVTALHACNTATDDAIRFALTKQAKHIVLVPCCQAEVAASMRARKNESLGKTVAFRTLAPPDSHARTGQPPDQRAALPAARSTWLRSYGDRTDRLGAFDEKRVDYCLAQRSTAEECPRAR